MRPVVLSVTGVGNSVPDPLDHYLTPFNVSLAVVVTGTITYTVQYTYDDVFAANYNPATGNWLPHPSLTAQTATKDSNIAYPVRGVRLTTSAGTGTATLTVIQAGGGGL
jgi:hypothetical protein